MESMREVNEPDLERARGHQNPERERLLQLLLAADRKQREATRRIPSRGAWAEPIPLSYAQERLWFLDQLGLVGSAYNLPLTLRLSGKLATEALERSFGELIRRHESLRTRFAVREGIPHQVIDPPAAFKLRQTDLSDVAGIEQREERLRELMRREHLQPFDLNVGPLLRILLVKLSDREYALLVTMHHIVVDGWSLGVFVNELSALYGAYVKGHEPQLGELPVQYADYAIWQRRNLQAHTREEHLQYWREQLDGALPQLQLPTDRPRPAVETFKGAAVTLEMPVKISTALKELGRQEGCTLFMVLLAAYQVLLARWSGAQDIVVGSPVAGRGHREIEGLIGFFVNTLALRTEVELDLSFRQLLTKAATAAKDAYAHQDLPFEVVVKELRPERNLSRQPIFQVMLALQNFAEERLELPGLTWSWSSGEYLSSHFDLTLYVSESAEQFVGVFEYATDLFDATTIERLAGHFRNILEEVVMDPDRPVGKLSLVGEQESRLLTEWNATRVPYPRERCVQEVFEEQVGRSAEEVAVVFGEEQVSYEQLNAQANQLARYLAQRGVGSGQIVGICVERSIQMVVGVLGILKAGAAYLPLDPNYPRERLTYMLEDAAPRVVLTQSKLRAVLPVGGSEVIALDEKWPEIAGYECGNFSSGERRLTAKDLVYVIYTSGSTGQPKGTAMPHGAMVNLIEWHRDSFEDSEGRRVLQFAALSFDVAFQEVFSTLCTGGTLVLLEEWVRRDVRALMKLLVDQRVERLFVPPLVLQSLAEYAQSAEMSPGALRDIITAGEQLRITPEIVSFCRRLGSCQLHNHYGPTETHVVTALTLSGDPGEWPALPAIGRPISNTQIYILDEQRQPVPIGVAGEIYIGGTGVARGYLGRAELTAQRFVMDPFNTETPVRMYKSGDLGRWRADGVLEYLGRNDDQVKIRGYRIELGEIETQLGGHEQVREVAVVARSVT